MSNKLWFKGGKLLADQNGRPYLCGKCPCGNEEEEVDWCASYLHWLYLTSASSEKPVNAFTLNFCGKTYDMYLHDSKIVSGAYADDGMSSTPRKVINVYSTFYNYKEYDGALKHQERVQVTFYAHLAMSASNMRVNASAPSERTELWKNQLGITGSYYCRDDDGNKTEKDFSVIWQNLSDGPLLSYKDEETGEYIPTGTVTHGFAVPVDMDDVSGEAGEPDDAPGSVEEVKDPDFFGITASSGTAILGWTYYRGYAVVADEAFQISNPRLDKTMPCYSGLGKDAFESVPQAFE